MLSLPGQALCIEPLLPMVFGRGPLHDAPSLHFLLHVHVDWVPSCAVPVLEIDERAILMVSVMLTIHLDRLAFERTEPGSLLPTGCS